MREYNEIDGSLLKVGDSGLTQFTQYANIVLFQAWAAVPSTKYVRAPAPVPKTVSYKKLTEQISLAPNFAILSFHQNATSPRTVLHM